MATKKTDTIAGKTIQLGLDHSVTIAAVRGRKVTIIARAPDGDHIRIIAASEKPGLKGSSEAAERQREPCAGRIQMNRNEDIR